MLVLENATRLAVNSGVREALTAEGVIAVEQTRFSILSPVGMTAQEKHFARFYARDQVIVFARDIPGPGIARDVEYRVQGTPRVERGRHKVMLLDRTDRAIEWDPRLGRASRVSVFREEARDLAAGDRIQWRLVNRELGIRNAERGTVEHIEGTLASVRWDHDGRTQDLDLSRHKTWDHGYAETVYSAQSKTYDRVFVLAPIASPLVTGQNYYTAITRARFGAKLWTEDPGRLVDKLLRQSGEKTSAIEGLGRLSRDSVKARKERHEDRLEGLRAQQVARRLARGNPVSRESLVDPRSSDGDLPLRLADGAQSAVRLIDQWLRSLIDRYRGDPADRHAGEGVASREPHASHQERELNRPHSGDGHER